VGTLTFELLNFKKSNEFISVAKCTKVVHLVTISQAVDKTLHWQTLVRTHRRTHGRTDERPKT